MGWIFRALTLALALTSAQAEVSVVIVTLDTTRADHLGAYGYQGKTSPHLDEFARESVLFEQAITPVPITLPAHCSLFTGTYPLYHGVRDFATSRLGPDRVTLAEIFQQQGYKTAAFIGSQVLHSSFGLNQGFEVYDEDLRFDPASRELERPAEEVVTSALDWIRKAAPPYFVWVHLFDPHDPYTPPEPFASQFRSDPYDGEIAYMDQQFGRLLRELPSQTIVIVAGDHGESLGEHGERYHGLLIYDATVHVPLLIRIPGVAARRVSEQVRLIDVMPTLLNHFRWPVPDQVQGKSFLSAMLGRGRYREEAAYCESFYSRIHMGWSALQGYRTSDFKFILAPREEFYDLRKDAAEKQNLRDAHQALSTTYRHQLENLISRYSAPLTNPQPPPPAAGPEQIEKLKSLGYVALSASRSGPLDIGLNLADPKDKISLFNLITEAIRLAQRETEKSITLLREVLAEDNRIAVAHFALGQNYMKRQRYIQAAEAFKETIQLVPDHSQAVYLLALSYAHMGRIEDAMVGFERVIHMDAGHYRAYHQLAAALLRRSRIPEAIDNLEKAVALEPRFAEGRNDLARLYLFQNETARAIAQLQAAIQADPSFTPAYFNLGTAYLKVGERQKARQTFDEARRLNPNLKIPEIP